MKGANRTTRKKSIDTEKDPYMPKLGRGGTAVCRRCSVVYHDKRWFLSEGFDKALLKGADRVVCPACRKTEDGFPEGYVTISGPFSKEHRDEIVNLIRNKEERCMRFNPLERVMELRKGRDTIEVTTTTEKLAQRIGQMLKKSFGGEVEYKWSSGVKLARVLWTR